MLSDGVLYEFGLRIMRVFTLRIMRESLHSHASQIGSPDKVCINSLPPDLPKCGHKEYALTKGREDGIFFPFACTRNRARAGSMKSAPIPRDLVELLGPDAAAQLWDEYGGTGYEAPEWWSSGVPNLIKLLRHELAEKEMWLAEDELLLKERVPREWVETARKEAAEAAEATAEAEEEIQELKKQLQEAKGREDALNGVIDRCRWGESTERGGKRPRSCE